MGRGGWKYAWYTLKRNPLTLAGAAVVLGVLAVALLAPGLAPYEPDKVDFGSRLLPPGPRHWFGTDELGRDILSRVIWGSRASVGAGLFIVAVSTAAGLVLGSISGYFGGRLDTVLMRLMDIVLGFPSLILAMALAAALGPDLTNAMLAVAFVRIPVYVRLVRGQSLQVREKEFVRGARCFGSSHAWIIARHVLPNSFSPVMVQATLDIGNAILTASALSFLGLGAQPPLSEWGAMVASGRRFILDQWWYPTFPGLAIFVTAMGFNVCGDGLRDLFDPRTRGQ